jgi:hypothetical protein
MEAREPLAQAELTTELIERALPSGRKLVVRSASTGDEVEIRAANGELDLRITLTDAGPVVSLRGARLEVDSPDVAIRCNTFDVEARSSVRVASEGSVRLQGEELRAETTGNIHLNGAFILLNCTDDAATNPETLLTQVADATMAAEAARPADAHACGDEHGSTENSGHGGT